MKNISRRDRARCWRAIAILLGCGVVFMMAEANAAEPIVRCREWYKIEPGGPFGPLFFQNGTISPRGGGWRSVPCSGSNADMFHVYTQAEIDAFFRNTAQETTVLARERELEILGLKNDLARREKQILEMREEIDRINDALASVDAKLDSLRAEVRAVTR